MKTFVHALLMSAMAAASTIAIAAQTALAPAPGFDGKTIRIGYVGPLSGPVTAIGQPVLTGLQLWVEQINERGGIAGKYKVAIVPEDHQNVETLAVQRYARIKDNVASMVMFGTHTTKAILPDLRRDHIVAAPFGFEGFMVKDPNLLPSGSTYELMAVNAVDYLMRKERKTDGAYCALIRDDAYGLAGLKGWKYGIEKSGYKLLQTSYFAATDRDFTGQINQLKGAGCNVVYVATVPNQLVAIVSNAARAQFAPRWVAQGPSWHGSLTATPVVDYLEKNVLIAFDGEEWGSAEAAGMKPMISALERFKPDQKPDAWIISGYNIGRVVTSWLELAVSNGDLSRDGLMKSMGSLGMVDNEGLGGAYKYGPAQQRAPAISASMFRINRSKPFGLERLEANYSSALAKEFPLDQTLAVPFNK